MPTKAKVPGRRLEENDYPNETLYRVYRDVEEERMEEDPVLTLTSADVDFKVKSNTFKHHTDEYHNADVNGQLVVRRGQAFDIGLKFNRSFSITKDELRLVFYVGKDPMKVEKSLVELTLKNKSSSVPGWGATYEDKGTDGVIVTVTSAADSPVGIWSLDIDTIYKSGDGKLKRYRYMHNRPIYILYNSWCKDDLVYMPKEEDRQEFVLKDTGKIAVGSSWKMKFMSKKIPSEKAWNYGQFEEGVLDCAMWLLDKKVKLMTMERGDPILISREISAFCNGCDQTGVLQGNWSGDYTGGKSPTSWMGSPNIIRKYFADDGSTVKFGQCWVFSGVVTSICRALGIPCRSVTNFDSAHDTDASTTIDVVMTSDGEKVEDESNDSVWNFHVWNDVWLKRPDLGSEFDGWQAIDATPQELTAHGLRRFCTGPTPLVAIKKGLVDTKYDTKFVFSEVNADRISWIKEGPDTYKTQRIRKNDIGTYVFYYHANEKKWYDIKSEYKYAEGTAAERATVFHAAALAEARYAKYEHTAEDVQCEFVGMDDIFVGSDFELTFKITNNNKTEKRTATGVVDVAVAHYNGGARVKDGMLEKKPYYEILDPGRTKEVKIAVLYDAYGPKLVEKACIKQNFFLKVKETNQIEFETGDRQFQRPSMEMKGLDDITKYYVDGMIKFEISVTNPLPMPLTGCAFEVEGPGIEKELRIEIGDVPVGGKAWHKFGLVPKKAGLRTIFVEFESKQLTDISGEYTVTVQPAKETAGSTDQTMDQS